MLPKYSLKEFLSKNPDMKVPSGDVVPASMWRGSYGVLLGMKSISLVIGSPDWIIGVCISYVFGTYDNQSITDCIPSRSFETTYDAFKN